MRPIRTLLIGTLRAAVWPGYLALAAYAARQAPWARSLAVSASSALGLLALAAFALNLIRVIFGRGGWAVSVLGVPDDVARQARRTFTALVAAHVVFLLPCWLLTHGFVAPGGRPVQVPTLVRGLVLAFELSVLVIAVPVVRGRSPVREWLARFPDRVGWLTRRRRAVPVVVLGPILGVFLLDARGYSFTAQRLASGMAGSLAVAGLCWGLQRLARQAIGRQAWRWVRVRSALARTESPDADVLPEDLAGRLRRVSGYGIGGLGLVLACWVWDVDLALFRFLGEQHLWWVGPKEANVEVTVGDLARSLAVAAVCVGAWRHMSTFFAVAVFPRMPDDPGVRFAVVTLCRYAVLGAGLLGTLSAVHLGLDKIGMVLAALGVGLGFGLQEIVSNFVCGIILLLERPIRVGDVVTVSGTTGKVDRIHIRATTIINGDNQCMIVPNRAFVTGDLVNWTLRDKVIRVTVRVKAAHGTDPDRVCDLLTAIAREDPDVLRNPLASALLEDLTDSALLFVLHAHVPDPSLAGRVKHRLYAQIQRRFEAEGIRIPLPAQELQVKPFAGGMGLTPVAFGETLRADPPSRTPPLWHRPEPPPAAAETPEPVDEGHRGVDE